MFSSFHLRRTLLNVCQTEWTQTKYSVMKHHAQGRHKSVIQPKLFLNFHHAAKSAASSKWKRYSRILGLGFGVGVALSGIYFYNEYNNKSMAPILNASEDGYMLQQSPPSHKPARSIRSVDDNTGFKITLYQYQTCPFCCKVRTFLDYYGFSYDVIEVNSVTRTQTKWTDYRKVPFLVIEIAGSDKLFQLKDSTMIISALQSYMSDKSVALEDILRGYPMITSRTEEGKPKVEILNRYFLMFGHEPSDRSKEDILTEQKWRKWVDDVFVHTLSPNVYRTPQEAYQAFTWFSKAGNWEEHFATWERLLVVYVGSAAMYVIGKVLKRRHGLKDDVRSAFYDEANVWLKALKTKGSKFMGGEEPNLSDLSVYGVLTAIEGCDAFQDLLLNTKIEPWFTSMKDVVGSSAGGKYLHK